MPSPFQGGVIRELLNACRLSVTVYPQMSACGSRNLGASAAQRCIFHLVGRGSCWMQVPRRPPVRLETGDLVLLPRNAWHDLGASPSAASPALQSPEEAGVSITCGYFEFGETRANPILEALPDLLIVRAREQPHMKRIADLFGMEAGNRQAGDPVVLDKLAELLFVLAVRAHLESSEAKRGLLAVLADPRVGRALGAIHREPGRNWHIDALAALAGMSRSAFLAAFSKRVGVPPMQYLAEWRMRRAAALLGDRRNSVGSVASRLGYRSEAAFRRAFRRLQGVGPGALRRC